MTDDRHYDLSITIVPGIAAIPSSPPHPPPLTRANCNWWLTSIVHVDVTARHRAVTHNAFAPKICRRQSGEFGETSPPCAGPRYNCTSSINSPVTTRRRSFRSLSFSPPPLVNGRREFCKRCWLVAIFCFYFIQLGDLIFHELVRMLVQIEERIFSSWLDGFAKDSFEGVDFSRGSMNVACVRINNRRGIRNGIVEWNDNRRWSNPLLF